MAEESTTRDLVELSYRRLTAVNRRDLDAVMSFFAADAVWDMSPIDMGIFEGAAAIRNALKAWWDMFPQIETALDEVLDLGNGVVLQTVIQRGNPADSTGEIHQRSARVLVVVDGLIESLTSYNNIDEARAAAERLAKERASAVSENLDLVRSIVAPWERGDYSTVDWAHPAIAYVHVGGPAPGNWTGVAGMAEGWREMLSVMTGHHVEAYEFRELDGGRVLVLFHLRGLGKTSGLDFRQMHAKIASLFHVDGGKVTKLVNYLDSNRALADAGLEG